MLRKKREVPAPPDGYWERRPRSRGFHRRLAAVISRELRALSDTRINDLVDAALVRKTIARWDGRLLNQDRVADLVIATSRRLSARLKTQHASVFDLLDAPLVADIEALLEQDIVLSRHAEEFVASIMRQEFVRRLFTDIIFTSIVAFQEKVNPLFGGLAMRLIEEQTKRFIDLFMPMLLQQATAFAINRRNQRILMDFVASIARHLLSEPLAHYTGLASPEQTRRTEALIRDAIGTPAAHVQLDELLRHLALAIWDDLYVTIADTRLGDLLRVEQYADRLAARCVAALRPFLERPAVRQFIAAELAAGPHKAPRAPKR